MTMPAEDEELTELVDADFPRVDLVGKGANGIPRFLIAKQDGQAGLLEPGFVRDLITKAEPDGSEEKVTMSGSPAAIAKLIHGAPVRGTDDAVAKAEMSGKSINDLPDSAFAYIEAGGKKDAEGKTTPRSKRHFPVHDEAHARNALSRAPQSPFGDKAMPAIRAAAKKFGIDVAKESEAVAKDMGDDDGMDDGIDGMDPTVPLAAPQDDDVPGDPSDPGSPAWEAVDAATAQKWTAILARARAAVDLLAGREMLEAASADPDDAENALDLQDVCSAIDYAISVLAPFAVAEQSEADCGAMEMEAIGKALAGFDPVPLDTIEGFAAIRKAGRVLSAANEAAIRSAAASLQNVLASLPSAPAAEEPVAKQEEALVAQPETPPASSPAAVQAQAPEAEAAGDAPAAQVAKAGKPAQVAVYDKNGNLVGICDPEEITPIAGADAPDDGDDAGDDGAGEDGSGGDGDGAGAPVADAASLTPAPAAEAGTPAEGVAKQDSQDQQETVTVTRDVLKSLVGDLVTAALGDRGPAEDIAKQDGVAGLGETVETLKARIAALEEQPAVPKVFTNGQVPPARMLRGQDQGAPPVDVAKAREMKQRLYAADAPEQNRIATEMQQAAIDQLAAIHARG